MQQTDLLEARLSNVLGIDFIEMSPENFVFELLKKIESTNFNVNKNTNHKNFNEIKKTELIIEINKTDLLNKINSFISNNSIYKALQVLEELNLNETFNFQIIILKKRYKTLRINSINNELSEQEINMERNKIINNIFLLIDEI